MDIAVPYFLARPSAAPPWPGVVVVMEGNGMSQQLLRVCQRFAAEGYVVEAPDLFHRFGGSDSDRAAAEGWYGKLTHADGLAVLLVRKGDRVHALADRCSHRGCSLHKGTLNDGTVTCPCHGSTFRLDGSIVKGPATSPQPSFDVRLSAGKVEIKRPA